MRFWALVACAVLLAGCANRGLVRYDALAGQAAAQEYLAAAEELRKKRSALYGNQSDLLFHMDLGLLYHYAGLYDSSIVHFDLAAEIHDELFTRSVSAEAASLLVNDNMRAYRGRSYEIIWLHVFQAYNYLAMGRLDGARVEMRRADLALNEVRRTAGNHKAAYRDDALYRATAALVYEALGETDAAAISIYFAIRTLRDTGQPVPDDLAAWAYRLLDAADRPNDIRELELSPPPGPDTTFAGGGEIIVIGRLGRSPALGETVFQGTWIRDGLLVFHYRDADGNRITDALPAPGLPPSEQEKAAQGRRTRSGTTVSVKWAMPALRNVPVQSHNLMVASEFGTARGETWGDTRTLLERDLEANHTAVLARTVTRVVVRTLAAQRAKSEMTGDNPWLNLLMSLSVDFFSSQMEQADVRLWFLLPRTVEVVRIPVPAGNHTLELGAVNQAGRTVSSEVVDVTVTPGGRTFVFFTSPR